MLKPNQIKTSFNKLKILFSPCTLEIIITTPFKFHRYQTYFKVTIYRIFNFNLIFSCFSSSMRKIHLEGKKEKYSCFTRLDNKFESCLKVLRNLLLESCFSQLLNEKAAKIIKIILFNFKLYFTILNKSFYLFY